MKAIRTFFSATSLALMLAASPMSSAQGTDNITMNMRDADIRSVIQWVSDLTGKNILVHNAVQGNVTVISSGPVSKDEAYQLFLSTLQLNGFAAQERNGVIKIVPASLAAQNASSTASNDAEVISKIIRLQNIPASQVLNVLKPISAEHAQLSVDNNSNSLIVVDRADNIRRMESIIARMDKPSSGEFDMVRLKHANAQDVMRSLNQLLPDDGIADSAALGVRFSADERSNSVLMFGDASKRANLRSLIRQLDQPVHGDGSTQVVYLNYVDAQELVPILKGMAETHSKDQGESEPSGTVSASKSTNALIINAPPALMADMKRVVQQIDIRKAQVLIEALVVEVNNSIANDIGVNWVTRNLSNHPSGGFGAVNTLGNLTLAASNSSATQFVPGTGATFGFFKDGNLRAAVRALSQNQKANILSTPTIIAMDNEEAELLVGQNIPLKTGEATSGASDTQNPFNTISRQDIGTTLKVTPRINQGDAIALKIEQKTEAIDNTIVDSAIEPSDIVTRKTEIRTRALIQDGEILVVGGLIRDEESEERNKVPVLGDVPVLGNLFRSKGIKKNKTNLMVFIHPAILKDEMQRNELTRKRYNFMRDQQEKISQEDWIKEYKFQPLLPDYSLYGPQAEE
jgi:general secretion pathway protein D